MTDSFIDMAHIEATVGSDPTCDLGRFEVRPPTNNCFSNFPLLVVYPQD